MLTVVVNNSARKEEIDFRERIKQTMIRQIKKKFFGAGERITIKHRCDAPFINNNSIQQ